MGIITNYERPKAENKYKADVDALIDAGEGAAFELIAPTKSVEGKRGAISTEHVRFQEAARDAGYTARQTESEDREDGTTRRVYVLRDKSGHTRQDASGEAATPAKPVK